MELGQTVTFAVVLSACFVACGSLKCHICSSADHTACEDPFDPARAKAAGFLTHCPEPKEKEHRTLCRKTHQTVRKDVRIIRACGYANHTESCYRTRNAEVVVRSCQCFKDECNGAGMATLTPAALLLAAALRAIY